jgi:sulfide:quinone oxidoreductase
LSRITIIGAGFAALSAARWLRSGDSRAEITLIAPTAEFIYLPSLIWIPPGLREPEQLRLPLAGFLEHYRILFHQGSATGLRENGRMVTTDRGELANDGLLIACGGRFMKRLPGIEHTITPCEGIPAAMAIRDRLRQLEGGSIAIGFSGNPKEPSAMRGGPMFEFLFGIDSMLRLEGRRDRFRLVFFTPAPSPGNRLGPKAVTGLLREMKRRGIETHLGYKIKGFTATSVQTEGGEIASDLTLFMPGLTGNQWFDATDLPRSEGGLIRADRYCRVEGMERVYVAGDAGSFPGPEWMPKQAHMADLQAHTAAVNLLDELRGKQPAKRFRVELICIVDSRSDGMLVARNEKYNLVLPKLRLFHWLKRAFEWWYLKRFR